MTGGPEKIEYTHDKLKGELGINDSTNIKAIFEQNEIKAVLLTREEIKALKEKISQEQELVEKEKIIKSLLIEKKERQGEVIELSVSERQRLKSEVRSAVGKGKAEVSDRADAAIDKAQNQVIEAVESKIPGMGGLLSFFKKIGTAWEKASEISKAKGFMAGVAIFFGLLFGKMTLADLEKDETEESGETEKPEGETETPAPTEAPEVPVVPPVEGNEEVKEELNTADVYYKLGITSIIGLSGIRRDTNDGPVAFNAVRSHRYSDIDNSESWLSEDKESARDEFDEVILGLRSDNTVNLLDGTLTNDTIKLIIKRDGKLNARLFPFFEVKDDEGAVIKSGEDRLGEIYGLLESGSITWKDLYINEIAILYPETVPAFSLLGFNLAQEKGDNIQTSIADKFLGNGEKGVEKIMEDKAEELVPASIITAFANNPDSRGISLGGGTYLTPNSRVEKEIGGALPTEVEGIKLADIIRFKDYIVEGDFTTDEKLGLEPAEAEMFKSMLDYRRILQLYLIMGGKELSEISFINLPIIAYSVSRIISSKNIEKESGMDYNIAGAEYYVRFGKEALDDDTSIFTPEQRKVIDVYLQRSQGVYLAAKLSQAASLIGLGNAFNENYSLSITLGVIGSASYATGKFLEKRGIRNGKISKPGMKTKSLGIISLFVATATAASQYSSDDFELFKDLQKMSSGNFRESLANIDTLTDSVEKRTVSIDGRKEEVSFIKYKNDPPFVIFNGKIWIFEVGGYEKDQNKTLAGGLVVDFSKMKIEGGNIVFGEGAGTYTIPEDKVLAAMGDASKRSTPVADMIMNQKDRFQGWVKDKLGTPGSSINVGQEASNILGLVGSMFGISEGKSDTEEIVLADGVGEPIVLDMGQGDLVLLSVGEV